MNNIRYIRSGSTKAFSLGLAIFFVVFCSCPVKKYIRLQLYKHNPLTEAPSSSVPQGYNIKEVKDCSYAEKEEQGQPIVLISALQRFDGGHDVIPFAFYAALSFTALYFYKRNEDQLVLLKPRWGQHSVLPLYLQLRHLRI